MNYNEMPVELIVKIITMRSKKTPILTVAIHTRNRRQSVIDCLESIKKQTIIPDEFIFIENVIENKFFSSEKIQSFFNRKVRCVYKTVHVNSRAVSRNLSLALATGDIYVSIDHDAYFADSSILERVLELHSRYKNVACFVGPVYPTGSSKYELFSSALYYPELIHEKMRKMQIFPTTFFSAKKELINKFKMKFNNKSNAEDIDFFWRLTSLGGQLIYSDALGVYAEFPDNIIDFIKKRYSYTLNNADLFVLSHGKIDGVSWLFLNSKIKLLLYPLFFIYHFFKNAHETILSRQIPKRYMFLSLVDVSMIAAGFFSSKTGRKLFYDSLLQIGS
jgi:glycosyltransferase involved in cell wall biosynthesis